MAVLGIPGSGKTVTPPAAVVDRRQAGMRVVFVDYKGTDPGPGLAGHPAPTASPTRPRHRRLLAHPTPRLWKGDGTAIANRLPGRRGLGQRGRRPLLLALATLASPTGLHPPSGPQQQPGLPALPGPRKLQHSGAAIRPPRQDLEQLAADPTVLAGVRGRYSAFFRALLAPQMAPGAWTSRPGCLDHPDHPAAPTPTPPSASSPGGPGPLRHPKQGPSGRRCCWSWMSSRPSRAAPTRPSTSPNASATSSRSSSAPVTPRASATNANNSASSTPSAGG